MEIFSEPVLLLISVPLYSILIGAEIIFSSVHGKHYYTLKDTLTNIYFSVLNMGLDVMLRIFYIAIFTFFYQYRIIEIHHLFLYWFALLVLQDFLFYFLHRMDHSCRLFWAVHVTHHSSQQFNLTVGFRSSVFQPLYRFVYFIPLALLGFKALDIMFIYSATQIYGILVHTQNIKRLGFLEYFLVTPSHHRVHHASNVKYLDKNMGMLLIIWDKIFGTFQPEEESEPVVYGLTTSPKKETPFVHIFHEWQNILRDLRKKIPLKHKVGYLFNSPGWSHDHSSKTAKELQAELIAGDAGLMSDNVKPAVSMSLSGDKKFLR